MRFLIYHFTALAIMSITAFSYPMLGANLDRHRSSSTTHARRVTDQKITEWHHVVEALHHSPKNWEGTVNSLETLEGVFMEVEKEKDSRSSDALKTPYNGWDLLYANFVADLKTFCGGDGEYQHGFEVVELLNFLVDNNWQRRRIARAFWWIPFWNGSCKRGNLDDTFKKLVKLSKCDFYALARSPFRSQLFVPMSREKELRLEIILAQIDSPPAMFAEELCAGTPLFREQPYQIGAKKKVHFEDNDEEEIPLARTGGSNRPQQPPAKPQGPPKPQGQPKGSFIAWLESTSVGGLLVKFLRKLGVLRKEQE